MYNYQQIQNKDNGMTFFLRQSTKVDVPYNQMLSYNVEFWQFLDNKLTTWNQNSKDMKLMLFHYHVTQNHSISHSNQAREI